MQGIEYETYTLSRREWVLYGAEGILLASVLDYVFYRSLLLILLILPAGILFPLALKKKLKQRRMEKLRGEFKDAILAVASGLNAGYSVENAFAVSLKEMEEIHGSDSMIAKEIRLILRKVRMNLTFEDALGDFAARSGLDDVENFADVFLAARNDADHHQDRRDHRGKDPDPGGDPDGNGIKTHGAKDHEWDSRFDRNLH